MPPNRNNTIRFTQLPPISSVGLGDLLAVVDTSVPTNVNKKISVQDFSNSLPIITELKQASARYDDAYTVLATNSAAFLLSGTETSLGDVPTLSGNWNSTYTTVQANSTLWTPVWEPLRFFNLKITPGFDNVFNALFQPKTFTIIPPRPFFITNYNNQQVSVYPSVSGIWIDTLGALLNIPEPTISTGPLLTYPSLSTFNAFTTLPTEIDCNVEGMIGSIINMTNLLFGAITGIHFPNLIFTPGISINNFSGGLSALALPKLKYVNIGSGYIAIGGIFGTAVGRDIEVLDLPELEIVNAFTFGGYSLNPIGTLTPGAFKTHTINMPKLKAAGAIQIGVARFAGGAGNTGAIGLSSTFPSLRRLEFPLLEITTQGSGESYFGLLRSLTAIEFPELKIMSSSLTFDRCTELRDLTFPKLKYIVGGYFVNLQYDDLLQNMTFYPKITAISAPEIESVFNVGGSLGFTIGSSYLFSRINPAFGGRDIRHLDFGSNKLKYFQTSFKCDQNLDVASMDRTLRTFAQLSGANGYEYYPLAGYFINFSLAGNNDRPSFTGGLSSIIGRTGPAVFESTGTSCTARATSHGCLVGDYVTFVNAVDPTAQPLAYNGTFIISRVISTDSIEFTLGSSYTGQSTSSFRFLRTPNNKTNGFYYYQSLASRNFRSIAINLPESIV